MIVDRISLRRLATTMADSSFSIYYRAVPIVSAEKTLANMN